MKVNIRSVFKICRNVNSFWNSHSTTFFFTSSSSSKQYSFLPFHFSKFDENPFYFLLSNTFPLFFFFLIFFFIQLFFFFHLWILAQTTTLKQTDQIPSWNTMDKGFKKERLIKRLIGWLAIMYQERKRKTHMWLKVDKNGLISSLKD